VPRQREFDVDETLDRAMHLFWRKGYSDTSVRDLTEYTGVAHAGLYSAFGGKEGLFCAAVELYIKEEVDVLFADLEKSNSGRKELEALFRAAVTAIKNGTFRNGCLMTNTIIEFADVQGHLRSVIKKHIQRQTKAFEGALRRAKRQGTVSAELDPKSTAALMTTTFHGLAVLARADAPISMIESSAEAIVKAISRN
jgi:TetR/AcrR family transcriptional repressor of nem operon